MADHYDALETRSADEREANLFGRLPGFLTEALAVAPGLREWLGAIDPRPVTNRAALGRLPVLRKPELMEMQAKNPPFGGFVDTTAMRGSRVFLSPGPVWEPQPPGLDPWRGARALFAAGFRPGDIVHNAFAYHLTPGGLILDEGARALGCTVFPAGVGNTEAQVDAAAALKPIGFTGTPDFLKVMLEKADEDGRSLASFRRALVSGGALFPSLRDYYSDRDIAVLQCYATADLGVIAYETSDEDGKPNPGMIVSEDIILEIVRPGTNETVPDGEVGEVVVTSLNSAYPLVRFGTGDLSAIMAGQSPCGRTNIRIKGWMGRADQRTKVKGMFVDPKQVAEIVRRHPEVSRARLVVARDGDRDVMTLHAEARGGDAVDPAVIEITLRDVTKLGGSVLVAGAGELPNDGKVIADERDYSK